MGHLLSVRTSFSQVALEEGHGLAILGIQTEMADLKREAHLNTQATLANTEAISKLHSLILEIVRSFFRNAGPTEPASELASEPASDSIGINSTAPSTIPTATSPEPTSPEHVETLVGIEGAIFDHLFRYIKTPENLYDAFENGFVGCPSIDVMDLLGGKYKRWRTGNDRHKRFHDWKVIIKDIRKKTAGEQRLYASAIHILYGMQPGGANSSLAKLIRAGNASEKRKRQDT